MLLTSRAGAGLDCCRAVALDAERPRSPVRRRAPPPAVRVAARRSPSGQRRERLDLLLRAGDPQGGDGAAAPGELVVANRSCCDPCGCFDSRQRLARQQATGRRRCSGGWNSSSGRSAAASRVAHGCRRVDLPIMIHVLAGGAMARAAGARVWSVADRAAARPSGCAVEVVDRRVDAVEPAAWYSSRGTWPAVASTIARSPPVPHAEVVADVDAAASDARRSAARRRPLHDCFSTETGTPKRRSLPRPCRARTVSCGDLLAQLLAR